jgi:hypothetical protein
MSSAINSIPLALQLVQTPEMELNFRQNASSADNIELMRAFATCGGNIHATGQSSQRNAVHVASLFGNVACLQLLASIGADFSCCDKDGKNPEALAKDAQTKQVFRIHKLGTSALAAKNIWYPKSIDLNQCSEQESKAHLIWREKISAFPAELSGPLKEIGASYTNEATKLLNIVQSIQSDLLRKKESDKLNAEVNAPYKSCFESLANTLITLHTLRTSISENQFNSACGESAFAASVYLIDYLQTDLPVEQIDLFDKDGKNHAIVLIGRDQSKSASDFTSWKQALVVDALASQIYFYGEAQVHSIVTKHDTSLSKPLDGFKIVVRRSNKLAPFPDKYLPKTAEIYHHHVKKVTTELKQVFMKRYTPTKDFPESKEHTF